MAPETVAAYKGFVRSRDEGQIVCELYADQEPKQKPLVRDCFPTNLLSIEKQ